jgi:hypothetical protein
MALFEPSLARVNHPTSPHEVGVPRHTNHPTSPREPEGDQEKDPKVEGDPSLSARAREEDLIKTLVMRVRREGDPLTEGAYRLLIREKGTEAVEEAALTVQMRYPPGRRTPWPSAIADLLGVEMMEPPQRTSRKVGLHNGLLYDGETVMETGARAEVAQEAEKRKRFRKMSVTERIEYRSYNLEHAGKPGWFTMELATRWNAELDAITGSTQESDLALTKEETA